MTTRPNRHVLYILRRYFEDPSGDRMCVLIYDTDWEAHEALKVLLKDDEILWEGGPDTMTLGGARAHDNWLRSSSGMVIKVMPCATTTRTLRELIEYELTDKEQLYDLSPNLVKEARIVRVGAKPREPVERKARGSKRPSSGPRTSAPAGAVHVSDVALSLGIDAKQARVALRKIYPVKPTFGWYFLPAELDDVKAKIMSVVKSKGK